MCYHKKGDQNGQEVGLRLEDNLMQSVKVKHNTETVGAVLRYVYVLLIIPISGLPA